MARGRKPDPNQYPLPLSGKPADNDTAKRIRAVDFKGIGLSRPESRNARDLLCKLSSLRDGIFARHETMAAWLDVSVSTVKRTIANLEGLGILRSRRRGHHNDYEIDFARLWSLGATDESIVQSERSDRSSRQLRVSNLNDQIAQNDNSPLKELTVNKQQTTSTTTAVAEEEEEILSFKAKCREHRVVKTFLPLRFDGAVSNAIANGCSVAQLRDRVLWFAEHRGDWHHEHRPGAFYEGLRDAIPSLDVNQGWPYKR